MPVLSKVAVGVAALVGGASAGSLTSTLYEDSQCAVRATECGLDDVNRPADGSDCAAADVTNKPAETAQWVSGECAACPAGEECSFPFFDMQYCEPAFSSTVCLRSSLDLPLPRTCHGLAAARRAATRRETSTHSSSRVPGGGRWV
jgi:hypothetical protein